MIGNGHYRGSVLSNGRRFGLAAAVLLVSFALSSPTWAVDVPFRFMMAGPGAQPDLQGVARLENGHLIGDVSSDQRHVHLVGDIRDGELSLEASGNFGHVWGIGNDLVSGSVRPATGEVTINANAVWTKISIYLKLPDAVAPTALPSTPAASAPVSPATTVPQIDPIDETYVAISPAKVREQPDVTAARVKTIEVGQKINVMGKLKGQDWYLVSENDKPIGYVIANQLIAESQYHPAVTSIAAAASAAIAPAPAQPAIPPSLANLDFGRYEALVIGNDSYRNGLPALQTAANDAQAISRTLRSSYGFRVTTLVNATRNQIIGALAKLRETLTWDDNLLIYYAGHGTFDQAGNQGYWLPVDAARDDPSNWVSNTDITTMLTAIQARHVLVVADSCYSGTLTRDANIGIRDADYIERMVQKKARTVMTSGGLEPVADSGGGGHSVFAAAFIAALLQNTSIMDAQSLFDQVREPVVLAAPQTPEYSNLRFAGHEGGDFVFVRR